MRLTITNGKVYYKNNFIAADIGIENGKIKKFGPPLEVFTNEIVGDLEPTENPSSYHLCCLCVRSFKLAPGPRHPGPVLHAGAGDRDVVVTCPPMRYHGLCDSGGG